jgi:hypothetical protein
MAVLATWGNSGVTGEPMHPLIKLRYRLLRLWATHIARLFIFISSDVTQARSVLVTATFGSLASDTGVIRE